MTGAIDFDVKLWDFAGMDASLQSFRSLRPCERYVWMKEILIYQDSLGILRNSPL